MRHVSEKQSTNRQSEAGSVLYWIFIAIAAWAALNFAVSNINRTGGTDMSELARLHATDIMQYAGAVQSSIKLMRINGVDESEICFHATQWGHTDYEFNPQCTVGANQLFGPDGGSINFQDGLEDWYEGSATVANDGSTWVFSSRYEVTDVGTDSGGAGTIADNAEIIMATAPVHPAICDQINLLLGYAAAPPGLAAGAYNQMAITEFVGTFADDTGRIGPTGRERCVADGNGYNVYYKVILAR